MKHRVSWTWFFIIYLKQWDIKNGFSLLVNALPLLLRSWNEDFATLNRLLHIGLKFEWKICWILSMLNHIKTLIFFHIVHFVKTSISKTVFSRELQAWKFSHFYAGINQIKWFIRLTFCLFQLQKNVQVGKKTYQIWFICRSTKGW